MKLTDYLHLKKPLSTEKYDVGVFNSNCDTVDSAVSDLNQKLTETNQNAMENFQTLEHTIQSAKTEFSEKMEQHTQNQEIHLPQRNGRN